LIVGSAGGRRIGNLSHPRAANYGCCLRGAADAEPPPAADDQSRSVKGGAMATHGRNGAAPVLELTPRSASGSRRQAPVTVLSPVAEVHETPNEVVVRVHLAQGALELSVPKRVLRDTRPLQSSIPGANPDATPC
jgi:hypothetical protein